MTEGSGFYHDPPLWVGGSPIDEETEELEDFDSLVEVVYQTTLPCGIDIRVTREGLFAFGFHSWELLNNPASNTGARITGHDEKLRSELSKIVFMNAFLALLYTNLGRYHRMMVTPELVLYLGDVDHPANIMAFRSRSLEYLTRSNDPISYNQNLSPMYDVRISERQGTVRLSDLRTTTDKLAEIMDAFPSDGLLLLDLFLRGSKAYQDHSYSSCLITNWAITEKLLQELWAKYQVDNRIRDGKPFITGQRLKRLQDGRTYTAAIIAEILSLSSYIDDGLYIDLGNVRKARNDWMHSLKGMIYQGDAKLATGVCERMFMQVRKLSLKGANDSLLWGLLVKTVFGMRSRIFSGRQLPSYTC